MQESNISWTDYTWNPLRGCSRISPGCVNCYAEKIAARFSGFTGRFDNRPDAYSGGVTEVERMGPFHGFSEFRIVGGKREAHWTGKVELIESKLMEPLSWREKAGNFAQKRGRRPRCFVNSMSDLFHESVPSWEIARVFAAMSLCREIDFLCLTKRARMPEVFAEEDFEDNVEMFAATIIDEIVDPLNRHHDDLRATWEHVWPLPNVWLGVSVEDQRRADERIPHLLRTPAAVRFLSCEPLLEQVRLRWEWVSKGHPLGGGPMCDLSRPWEGPKESPGIDWVITGAESGPGARPCNEDWIRLLRDQCEAGGVAFFYKQAIINGKKVETPELDGKRWVEFPEVAR